MRMTERFVERKYLAKDPGFWGRPKEVVFSNWIRHQLDFEYFTQRYGPLLSLLNELRRLEGSVVLDSGCGLGRVSILLSEYGTEVLGIDLDTERLTIARLNAERWRSNPHFLQTDARELPFPDETFDVVVCIDVTEHLPSIEAFFLEARRVVKRTGIICCTFKNKYYWYDSHYCLYFLTWLPTALANLYTRIVRNRTYQLYCFSFGEVKKILARTELEPKRISTVEKMENIFENPHIVDQIKISYPIRIGLKTLVLIFRVFRKESILTMLVTVLAPSWTMILQRKGKH